MHTTTIDVGALVIRHKVQFEDGTTLYRFYCVMGHQHDTRQDAALCSRNAQAKALARVEGGESNA